MFPESPRFLQRPTKPAQTMKLVCQGYGHQDWTGLHYGYVEDMASSSAADWKYVAVDFVSTKAENSTWQQTPFCICMQYIRHMWWCFESFGVSRFELICMIRNPGHMRLPYHFCGIIQIRFNSESIVILCRDFVPIVRWHRVLSSPLLLNYE